MLLRFSTQTLVLSAVLLSAGCKDRDIVVYRTAKETPPPAMAQSQPAPSSNTLPDGHPPIGGSAAAPAAPAAASGSLPDGHPSIGPGAPAVGPVATAPDGSAMGALPGSAVAAGNALVWTAPAHWQAKNPGSIRKGSYAVTGPEGAGDLSVTAFPGDTGGLHANLNRWRGQIGLPNAGNAELEKSIEHIDANGLHIDFVEMAGPSGIRLLGAIVPHQQETWFFKLTGPDALIARERAAFREFLATIKVR